MGINAVRLAGIISILMVFVTACGKTSEESRSCSAEKSYSGHEYSSAIIELKTLLQREPDNVSGRWLLGEVYLAIENGAAAEKEFRQARSLGVVDDSLCLGLRTHYVCKGKWDDIINLKVHGPLSSSSFAELDAHKGLAHLERREMEMAESLVDAAVATTPDSTIVLFAQARLLATNQKFEEAKTAISHIEDADPKKRLASSLLGDILMAEKKYVEAEAAYARGSFETSIPLRIVSNVGLPFWQWMIWKVHQKLQKSCLSWLQTQCSRNIMLGPSGSSSSDIRKRQTNLKRRTQRLIEIFTRCTCSLLRITNSAVLSVRTT